MNTTTTTITTTTHTHTPSTTASRNASRTTASRTSGRMRAIGALAVTLGTTAGLAVTAAGPVGAAFPQLAVVTNTADDGSASSLRSTISDINIAGEDWVIRLTAGATYEIDLHCQQAGLDDNHGGDLDIWTDGDIRFESTGGGLATIAVQCVGERAIDHLGDGQLQLDGIRITGGNTAAGPSGIQEGDRDGRDSQSGGAVRSTSGAGVHITGSVFEGNRTGNGGNGAPPLLNGPGGDGGDAGIGGAIHAMQVTAIQSRFTGNSTGNGGKGGNAVGSFNPGGNGGMGGRGTIATFDAVLVDTQVDGNVLGAGGVGGSGLGPSAPGGDGGNGGSGGAVFGTTLTMEASTLAGNTAGAGGKGGNGNGAAGGDGGDAGHGGAAVAPTGTVSRSTIHLNAAGVHGLGGNGAPAGTQGAVGYGGGLSMMAGLGVTMDFSTVVANTATAAANLAVAPTSTLTASIVGGALGGGASCSNFVLTGGGNVMDAAGCGVGPDDHLLPALPLSALGDHGGPTQTMLPIANSVPHGLIPAADCETYLTGDMADQRGERLLVADCEPGAVELGPVGASSYVPLAPARVFDTGEAGPYAGFVGAGQTRTVTFAGAAGIPASGVSAVAFNLTLDATAGAGFVTVTPTGQERQLTSSVNAAYAGQTVPNLVIVPLGTDGQLDFFVQRGTHLIADAVGYFVEAPAGATAGRIIPVPPARAFDTRTVENGWVPAGGRLDVDVTGIAGVPETGVAAVVINLTGTAAGDAGYLTTWAGGQPQPFAASLNLTRPNHTAGNMTIVPVGDDGTISIYTQSGAHLIGDITGWVTDETASFTTEGLYVPLAPCRWFDTREAAPAPGYLGAGTSRYIQIPTNDGVPWWADATPFNLTATDPAEPGFITGWATGWTMPTTSSLNLDDGVLRGNAALLPVGQDSKVSFYSNMGAHLVADVYGYLIPSAANFDE